MKKILLIIVPIIAIAVAGIALYCNRETKPLEISSGEEPKVASGKYYFDFDEVIYYTIEIDEDKVSNSMIGYGEEKYKTERDSLITEIMIEESPYELADASFESNMEKIGFTNKKLSERKFIKLKEIFREKPSIPYDVSCIPIYRDIYVFKKNGKISGVAKLCYDCNLSYFVGADADTGSFGEYGEFEELKELVK